jgi:tetratricopeptide (TPR) repeat protein
MLITLLIVLPGFSQQSDDDREVARTQDYIAAVTKQGAAKIDALKAYIKKFPDTTQRWTKMAYYSLAIAYYEVKNYAQAINVGEQRLKMGEFGTGEEGRLSLVVANSYGIKSESVYNKDKALKYINKAIDLAKKSGDKDVLKTAQALKQKLSAPPPPKMTPEQKIKRHYSSDEYSEAISYYKSLGASDKSNFEIHLTYANALFKANNLDSALKEYQTLYSKGKKGIIALRIGDVYSQKAKRNKTLFDSAANYYLEAGLLYNKEGNNSNMKIAFNKGQFQLFEKYDFNEKVKRLEAKQKQSKASAQKNEDLIRKKKYELRKVLRKIRDEYDSQNIEAPLYLRDQVENLEKEIAALEAGGSTEDVDEAAKLEDEKQRIQKEFEDLKAKAQKRLNL